MAVKPDRWRSSFLFLIGRLRTPATNGYQFLQLNGKNAVALETHHLTDGVAVIFLSGDLNANSLTQFKEEVRALMADDIHTIVVDCRELGMISSSGLAALLWARTKVNVRGGKIYFTHVSAVVADVLAITKLSSILSIAPTTREVLVRLGKIRSRPTVRQSRA